MRRKIIIFLLLFLIVGIIAIYIYDVAVLKSNPTENLLRTVLIFASLFLSFVRVVASAKPDSLPFYENAYSEELNMAFENNKKLRQKLLGATRDYNNGNIKRCINTLLRLLEKTETVYDKCSVKLFLALCMEEAKKYDLAVEWYLSLLGDNPYYSTALSNLSVIYEKTGNTELAVKYGKKAINSNPDNAFAYSNVASAYFSDYDIKNAEEFALKALEIKSNLKQAASLLAIIYSMDNNLEKAQKYSHIAVTSGEDAEELEDAVDRYRTGYLHTLKIKSKLEHWNSITALPSIKFTLNTSGKKSIIGGKISENPPIGENGKPMRLLAAVFCSELPKNPIFPEKGVIRFYITPDDLYGLDIDNLNSQKNFKILFSDDETAFETYDYENKDGYFPVLGSFRPTFRFETDGMTFDDYRFDETFEKISKEYSDIISPEDYSDDDFMFELSREEHKMGGYPCFIQCDPREGEEELQKYDTLLFQLASDYAENEKVMFGDGGVCNFFIPSENLKNRDFSDILYTWDCG